MSYRRADGVIHEVVDDKAMLVSLSTKELLTLNTVGTMVWEALPTCGDVAGIAKQLSASLDRPAIDELESDVRSFLDELKELGLVVDDG